MDNHLNIAIDGPAGAGKSTIARAVAGKLGFVYVDTGAMYRAIALYMLRQGMTHKEAVSNPEAFSQKVSRFCQDADVTIAYQDGEQVVMLNGENVNAMIRTEKVSTMASAVSAVKEVRRRMVALQQSLAHKENVVMDGRDIGTVVLPDAEVKIFLTASPKVRARRRYLENLARRDKGARLRSEDLDLAKIEKDIRQRDYDDTHRAISPLRQAEDAVLVDSSDMTPDQVTETILNLVAVKKNRTE